MLASCLKGGTRPFLEIVLLSLSFLVARIVLTQWPARLPAETYFAPVISLQAVTTALGAVPLLVAVGIGAALVLRGISWRDPELRTVYVVMVAIALALGWQGGLYAFNHYFAQAHLIDRGLVLVLAGLTALHPVFFPLFLWIVVVVLGQFRVPIGYSWTDVGLVLDASAILVTGLGFRCVGLVRGQGIVLTLVVLAAGHYFDAARTKYEVSPAGWEWAIENDLANLFVSSHLNGWLPNLSPVMVLAVAGLVSLLAVPLQVFTLLVEAASGAMLVSRRTAIAVLGALVLLHAAILASSGIFFWKWVVFDGALAYVLWRWGTGWFRPRWIAVAVIPLIVLADEVGVGADLGWWDTRLSQYHELWAVAESGERWRIDEHDLRPYDKTVAQDRLFYLHREPRVTGTLGATLRYRDFAKIQHVEDADTLRTMITSGTVRHDEGRASRFDTFVQRFVASYQRHRHDLLPRILDVVGPPMHITHWSRDDRDRPAWDTIARVEVFFREVWYDGLRMHLLREVKVREVQVAESPLPHAQP